LALAGGTFYPRVVFRQAPDHFEGVSTFIASVFIYRHAPFLHFLFLPFLSILDIADARQSGFDAELGKNVDIDE
jgi:hypothetical protein